MAAAAKARPAAAGRGVFPRGAGSRRARAFHHAHQRWKIPTAREARRPFARADHGHARNGGQAFLFPPRRGSALARALGVGRCFEAAARRRLDAHDAIRAPALAPQHPLILGQMHAGLPRGAARTALRQDRFGRGVFYVRALRRKCGGRARREPAVVRQARERSLAARGGGAERAAAEPDGAASAQGGKSQARRGTGTPHGTIACSARRAGERTGCGFFTAPRAGAAARPALRKTDDRG